MAMAQSTSQLQHHVLKLDGLVFDASSSLSAFRIIRGDNLDSDLDLKGGGARRAACHEDTERLKISKVG